MCVCVGGGGVATGARYQGVSRGTHLLLPAAGLVRMEIQYITPARTTRNNVTEVSLAPTMDALVMLTVVLWGTFTRVLAGFSHPAWYRCTALNRGAELTAIAGVRKEFACVWEAGGVVLAVGSTRTEEGEMPQGCKVVVVGGGRGD